MPSRYRYKKWYLKLLVSLFDAAGSALFLFRNRAKPSGHPPKNIFVFRPDGLGDFIMTWPAILALRRHYPEARIDLILSSEAAPLLSSSYGFKVISFKNHWYSGGSIRTQCEEFQTLLKQLKQTSYDLGIDFRGDLRNIVLMKWLNIKYKIGYPHTGGGFLLDHSQISSTSIHQMDAPFELLKAIGINTAPHNEGFVYSDEEKAKFLERFPEFSRRQLRIIIHAGAGYPSKLWPKEKYREVISALLANNAAQLVLIGTESEKAILGAFDQSEKRLLDLRGKTAIKDLPVLFGFSDLYVGNDSGPAHLAAAQKLPLVILFSGTNDFNLWHPRAEDLQLLYYKVPCSPCESRECPLLHHDCMKKVSVSEVLSAIHKALERIRSGSTNVRL
jgi:heptosyltransferase II